MLCPGAAKMSRKEASVKKVKQDEESPLPVDNIEAAKESSMQVGNGDGEVKQTAPVESVERGNESSVPGEKVKVETESPVQNLEGENESGRCLENMESGRCLENMEDGRQSGRSEEVRFQRVRAPPREPTSPYHTIAAILAVPIFVLGGYFVKLSVDSKNLHDFLSHGFAAAVCIFFAVASMFFTCYRARQRFNVSRVWNDLSSHGYSRVLYRKFPPSSNQQGDIESQSEANSTSQPVVTPGSSDPSTSATDEGEKLVSQAPENKDVSSVKILSEVAASVSKIAFQTVSAKGDGMESSTSEDETTRVKIDSDLKIPSSGELRRRKMLAVDELKFSSDEEK